jgi:transcription-repair coupling factor (superfamily II helicase)
MQAKIYEYLKDNSSCEILITKDDEHSNSVHQVAKFLQYKSFTLPDFRATYGDDLRSYKDEVTTLLNSLREFYKNNSPKKILISPFRTLLNPLVPPELFKEISLEYAQSIDLLELKDKLFYWGYEFVELVTVTGEVSFRGDIIDIFPINSDHPYRVSLFDDTIEGIKKFEITTQKSFKDDIDLITIPPALFALDKNSYEDINKNINSIVSDSFSKDIHSLGLWGVNNCVDFLKEYSLTLCEDITRELDELKLIDSNHSNGLEIFKRVPIIDEAKEFKELLTTNIKEYIEFHSDKNITILAYNDILLKQANIDKLGLKVISTDSIVNIYSNKEVILSLNKEKKRKRKKRATLILDELKVGSYVVHETHGIGIFKGLKNSKVLGAVRDFVEIAYQGDDRLLIPVENLETIDRYISDGSSMAIVDKLGRGSFIKLKEKSKKNLFEIAANIIKVAAKRELESAPVIKSSLEDMRDFQKKAGFNYTKDQIDAVENILKSFQSGSSMDRLLSGDVGFGKTEVALNAIFATVRSGFQAAFIVPTTLLSYQHFKSLHNRLEPYGIKVAKLDRFTKPKDKKAILTSLKNGEIDVCIGTHSLFGVEFKNIAFLTLDEEHKFGVKQKERLKEFKKNLHILSMSATPIPRSLNMALSSIKEYSTLTTPPSDREDVQTFVKEYSDNLIKEVILRELRRGGQIFFIHNNIASIESKKEELKELIPDLKITLLHSKIPASTTEKEMLAFEKGEYDLLISTSIVESGIHIPNVNSIIIENSHKFGIADLHQLRGRVGRGSKRGYCYMLVPDKDDLSDESKKRLLALESNSFLGSGAMLAYHDLEIRGGGNLIGEAQSGHIKGIGYKLYLRMLEDALSSLLNRSKESKKSTEVKLTISAYINSATINEDRVRLELYKRLSGCSSPKEIYEIEEEMIDRFGTLDIYTKQFLQILIIKVIAIKKGIKQIMNYNQNITILYNSDKKEYLTSNSKDDDDIIESVLKFLQK